MKPVKKWKHFYFGLQEEYCFPTAQGFDCLPVIQKQYEDKGKYDALVVYGSTTSSTTNPTYKLARWYSETRVSMRIWVDGLTMWSSVYQSHSFCTWCCWPVWLSSARPFSKPAIRGAQRLTLLLSTVVTPYVHIRLFRQFNLFLLKNNKW